MAASYLRNIFLLHIKQAYLKQVPIRKNKINQRSYTLNSK